MNKLPHSKRAQIINMLVEGSSLRATSRMADVAYNTVLSLLVNAGRAASDYQYKILRSLPCKRVQVDEIWSFCYAKQKNVKNLKSPNDDAGDVWTWVAMCPDTKLIISWLVGDRSARNARLFIEDLAPRLANRVHLTTDGYKAYPEAVERTFGEDIDYSMLTKLYDSRQRYVGSEKEVIIGEPDLKASGTSIIERQNLTMRMGMRRFTRKTNGFSKKIHNHECAVGLHFLHYNFARIHQTLRVTPAMAAGIADHVWGLEEIVNLMS